MRVCVCVCVCVCLREGSDGLSPIPYLQTVNLTPPTIPGALWLLRAPLTSPASIMSAPQLPES